MTAAPTAVTPTGPRASLLDGLPVAPLELLAARDDRVSRRRAMQRRHPRATVVGLSLVVPGPVKSSPRLGSVRDEAVRAVIRVCGAHGWAVHQVQTHDALAGPEAEIAVMALPHLVKSAMTWLEDEHPVGRLWDLDVHDGDDQVSRSSLGHPPRTCLVCDEPAHECARAARHPLSETLQAVEVIGGRLV